MRSRPLRPSRPSNATHKKRTRKLRLSSIRRRSLARLSPAGSPHVAALPQSLDVGRAALRVLHTTNLSTLKHQHINTVPIVSIRWVFKIVFPLPRLPPFPRSDRFTIYCMWMRSTQPGAESVWVPGAES